MVVGIQDQVQYPKAPRFLDRLVNKDQKYPKSILNFFNMVGPPLVLRIELQKKT